MAGGERITFQGPKGEQMDTETAEVVWVLLVIAACFAVYMIPTWIAMFRGHRNHLAIFALNLLLGWSVLGWVAALVWALMADQRPVRRRY